jgi:hypothetical protein
MTETAICWQNIAVAKRHPRRQAFRFLAFLIGVEVRIRAKPAIFGNICKVNPKPHFPR